MEWDIEFSVPFPKIPSGKYKGQLATMNRLPLFHRYGITKIKQEFKQLLEEWYIKKNTEIKYKKAEIHFTIQRNSNRKIDSDSMSYMVKYVIDTLVHQKFLEDDDQCRITLEPTQLGIEGVETSILVQVKFQECT